jgi:hypothetical protein
MMKTRTDTRLVASEFSVLHNKLEVLFGRRLAVAQTSFACLHRWGYGVNSEHHIRKDMQVASWEPNLNQRIAQYADIEGSMRG